ncbi:DUF3221 domain-containing protein [Marinicrinis sediminis]|uniref:DUF3221 domain-containing protein n=1 Tax=Marinicrinis sediminis TaxID=1652465 RepID=A0ABW5RF99_9BACL
MCRQYKSILLILLIFITACSTNGKNITGYIVKKDQDGRVLITNNSSESYNAIWFVMSEKTKITGTENNGQVFVGQQVTVAYSGNIDQSNPPISSATNIKILNSNANAKKVKEAIEKSTFINGIPVINDIKANGENWIFSITDLDSKKKEEITLN